MTAFPTEYIHHIKKQEHETSDQTMKRDENQKSGENYNTSSNELGAIVGIDANEKPLILVGTKVFTRETFNALDSANIQGEQKIKKLLTWRQNQTKEGEGNVLDTDITTFINTLHFDTVYSFGRYSVTKENGPFCTNIKIMDEENNIMYRIALKQSRGESRGSIITMGMERRIEEDLSPNFDTLEVGGNISTILNETQAQYAYPQDSLNNNYILYSFNNGYLTYQGEGNIEIKIKNIGDIEMFSLLTHGDKIEIFSYKSKFLTIQEIVEGLEGLPIKCSKEDIITRISESELNNVNKNCIFTIITNSDGTYTFNIRRDTGTKENEGNLSLVLSDTQ